MRRAAEKAEPAGFCGAQKDAPRGEKLCEGRLFKTVGPTVPKSSFGHAAVPVERAAAGGIAGIGLVARTHGIDFQMLSMTLVLVIVSAVFNAAFHGHLWRIFHYSHLRV